jgi:hypothetical protein
VLLDYLMIHYEILQLYSEGHKIDRIAQELIGLPAILKDQPNKLGQKHFELLKLKLLSVQNAYGGWKGEQQTDQKNEEGRLNAIPERKYLIQNGFF